MRVLESVVSDYEYRQRVRRYKPSCLVPLIAAAAARYWQQQDWLNSPYRKYTPWALADAARVSLALGNEYRSDATDQDLLQATAIALMLVVPFAFFPYSKTLFLAFDLMVRPPTEEDFVVPHEEAWNVRRKQT